MIITQDLDSGKLTLPELLEEKLCNITILEYLRIKCQETFLWQSFVRLGVCIPGKKTNQPPNHHPTTPNC